MQSQKPLNILITGDSPLIQTGFGRVNYRALKAFKGRGWTVAAVTAQQGSHVESELLDKQFNPDIRGDVMGLMETVRVLESGDFEPDVVFATGDPGSIAALSMVIPARIPFYGYVPIEGEPLIDSDWVKILSNIDFMTCTEYGATVVKADIRKDVEWVYHGVDPTKFFPMPAEERDAYRERLGWDGKFVIISVAQNVRRKQLPRLIEAVAILKNQFKQSDVRLYLHCIPYQHYWLEGWRLFDVARGFGVNDEVIFNPLLSEHGKSVPEVGDMDVPGVRELLCAADLFVLPSQVEGFGLPIAEAMACGTPVLVTKYAAGWEVAKKGMGAGIPIHDWEIHKSGTKYGNVNPFALAKEILSLKRDPKRRSKMSAAGIEAATLFDWQKFEDKVCAEIEKVVARSQTGAHEAPEADSGGQEAGSPTGILRETPIGDGPAEGEDSSQEQGQNGGGRSALGIEAEVTPSQKVDSPEQIVEIDDQPH